MYTSSSSFTASLLGRLSIHRHQHVFKRTSTIAHHYYTVVRVYGGKNISKLLCLIYCLKHVSAANGVDPCLDPTPQPDRTSGGWPTQCQTLLTTTIMMMINKHVGHIYKKKKKKKIFLVSRSSDNIRASPSVVSSVCYFITAAI